MKNIIKKVMLALSLLCGLQSMSAMSPRVSSIVSGVVPAGLVLASGFAVAINQDLLGGVICLYAASRVNHDFSRNLTQEMPLQEVVCSAMSNSLLVGSGFALGSGYIGLGLTGLLTRKVINSYLQPAVQSELVRSTFYSRNKASIYFGLGFVTGATTFGVLGATVGLLAAAKIRNLV